jgi:hypothetical protein
MDSMQKMLVVWLFGASLALHEARADTDTDDSWETGGSWDTDVEDSDTDPGKDTDSPSDTDVSDTDASDTDASDTDASDTDASDTDASDTDASDTGDTGFAGGVLASDVTGERGGAACAFVTPAPSALAAVGFIGLAGMLRRRRREDATSVRA